MNQTMKTSILVVLGLITAGMLFLAAFRFFAPEQQNKLSPKNTTTKAVTDDTESTLFVSEDGGSTWRGIPDARFGVSRLLFSRDGTRLIIGTSQDGLWQSDAELKKVTVWHHLSDTKESAVYDVVLTDRSDPEVYAAVSYNGRGRVVSVGKDTVKERYFTSLEDVFVRGIAKDPINASRIFFISGDGFFESRDGGTNWRAVYWFRSELAALAAHPILPGMFFVATKRGELFRSFDYGVTWENSTRSLSSFRGARDNQRLYADPTSGAFYLTSDYGILVTGDNGALWKSLPFIVPRDSLPLTGFAVDRLKPQIFYVSASNQLYKSTDEGSSWRGHEFSGKGAIAAIAVDPKNSQRIIIGFSQE